MELEGQDVRKGNSEVSGGMKWGRNSGRKE